MIGKVNDAMPKIYDFDKYRISVFSDTIIQIKSVDIAQKLPKIFYTKFNSLSLKFA